MWRAGLVLVAVVLAGCPRPPQPIAGAFPAVTVNEAQQYDHNGERVRWGGTLVATTSNDDGTTCFQVISKPLDRRARPQWTDQTYGRFLACRGGFYDPAIYSANRDITITGTIDGSRSGRIGNADYTFPLLRADSVYLWPDRPVVDYYDGGYYYDPYPGVGYGGFWPYYYGGPYWGPYWGWGWGGYWPGYWGRGWGYWGGRRYWGGPGYWGGRRYWGGGRGHWGGGGRYYGGGGGGGRGGGGGGGGRGGGGGGGGGGRGGGGGGGGGGRGR